MEAETPEETAALNGENDCESSDDSDDDGDERYTLTVEQKRTLKLKKDTYRGKTRPEIIYYMHKK